MLLILLVRVAYLKLWNACPIFFYYLTFVVAKTGVLLLAGHSRKAYFLVYWIGDFVEAVLVVAILYQLYSYLFRDYSGFGALQNALFRWSAAVSILASVIVAAKVHGSDSSRIMAGLLALSLAAAVVKAGLILFVIVLSSALALRWGHYAFGVLVGLGLYTTVEMASVAALLQYGPPASATFQLIKPGAYTCAVIVWVVFFLSKEQKDASANVLPENNLAAWNQALMEILTR
ncbi:MAG: hypothetical protein ACXVZJ_01730 [Terriglobales bacterium]